MTRVSRSLFVGMLLAAALIKADHLLARDLVTVDLTQWSLPTLPRWEMIRSSGSSSTAMRS
jgi:hypothetical protein